MFSVPSQNSMPGSSWRTSTFFLPRVVVQEQISDGSHPTRGISRRLTAFLRRVGQSGALRDVHFYPLRGACPENRESSFSGLFEILLPSRSVSRHKERSR